MLAVKTNIQMKFISKIIQKVALIFVRNEWVILRQKLIITINLYQKENIYIPPNKTIEMLVAGEDHRFYSHPGVDLIAIGRAIWKRYRFSVIEGASTIEQQLVRVLTGNYERKFKRKFKEIMLATLLSEIASKETLAKIYLTVAYYGWKMNGYKQACIRLNLNPENINKKQAASLVARLKYPEPKEPSLKKSTKISIRTLHIIQRNAHNETKQVLVLAGKTRNATI